MKEMIYRQDAIDAICKACSMEGDYHKCDGYSETSTWCDELVALRALPSAQPEIIHCKDCKYYINSRKIVGGTVGQCESILRYTHGDWFCGNAERRTDGV